MTNKLYLYQLCLAVLVTCGLNNQLKAQGVSISIETGHQIQVFGKDLNNMKGSPYFYDDWSKGSVKLANGVVHEGVDLLYDQMSDELIFRSENGNTQLFMYPVQEFSLQHKENNKVVDEKIFRNGFPATNGESEKAFYEILLEGNMTLLKRSSKAVVEERPENSIVKEKMIKESTKYYVFSSDKMLKVNPNKRSVLSALEDNEKSDILQKYIKESRLNINNESALVELIAYYNSL